MSTVIVTDLQGNPISLTEINSICPVEYAIEARQIAYDYFIEIENCTVNLSDMFQKFLKPIGSETATHVWCPRVGYSNQLAWQLERMASQDLAWIKSTVASVTDPDCLTKFCVLTDPKNDILTALNLEEI